MPVQMTVHLCLACGSPFEVSLAEVKRGSGKYCSNRCVGMANRGVNLVDCVCRQCGASFRLHQSRVVLGEGLYCSRQCFAVSIRVPIEERFWQHVQRCDHEDLCPYCCWPWQGKRRRAGYGVTTIGRVMIPAHRQAWALHHSVPLPSPALVIRHLCNVPPCCNPVHLMSGSVQDNAKDRVRSGRSLKGERHPHTTLTDTQVQEIYLLRHQGISAQVLAEQYHVSHATISNINRHKVWTHLLPQDATPYQGPLLGKDHPKAKFTEDDIRTIRALHAAGENCVALGKRFGASDETIRMIVLRKTWRHVL